MRAFSDQNISKFTARKQNIFSGTQRLHLHGTFSRMGVIFKFRVIGLKPDTRTLLQVRAEDDTEADLMFTTLMGDHVEPRRKFIEENALDVQNLDV